ncbi:MAG: Ig domain-containing protein [Paludibacter sp.]|nr:Ig domain-containing protein [Paludibacter sp.]
MKNIIKINLSIAIIAILTFSACTENEVNNVSISKNTLTLNIGQTDSLFADTDYSGNIVPSIVWTSDNNAVVTVKDGEIEALKKGTAVIKATAGDKSATCTITVDDKIEPLMTQGELWYYGDGYDIEISNNFVVYLGSAGINMTDFSGEGQVMYLEFNTGLGSVTNLPSGTYTIVDANPDLFTPSTMVSGFEYDSYLYGTWYFGNTTNSVIAGSAVVTQNTGNKYAIQYDFIDQYGNNIKGTFNGTLDYYDGTQSQEIIPAAKNKALKRNFSPKVMSRIK